MGIELVGDHLSRGTNQLGNNCGGRNVQGPYGLGTKRVTAIYQLPYLLGLKLLNCIYSNQHHWYSCANLAITIYQRAGV